MVKAFIGHDLEPMSPPTNEGDGHRMAMEAGARLANMTHFWGQPAFLEPGAPLDNLEYLLVITDYQGGLPDPDQQPVNCDPDDDEGTLPEGEQPCIEPSPAP